MVYGSLYLILALATAGPFLFETSTEWNEVYGAAGARLGRGEDLYPPHTPYTYPPLMGAVALVVESAGVSMGRVIWLVINLLAGGLLLGWGWWLTRSPAAGSSEGRDAHAQDATSAGNPLTNSPGHLRRTTACGSLRDLDTRWGESAGGESENQRAPDGPASRAGKISRRRSWQEDVIFVLGLLCGVRYLLNGFSHLQTDIVIAALMMGGCWELSSRRPGWSGVLFGLATAIKGPAALWLGYLLFRGHGRAAGMMVVTTLCASLLPDLIAPAPNGSIWLSRWFQTQFSLVSKVDHYPGVWASTIENNQSLAGLVCRATIGQWERVGHEYVTSIVPEPILSPGEMKRIIYGIELGIGLVTLAAFLRNRRQAITRSGMALEAGVVLTLIVLVSPMSSKPHFAPMMLAGWVLARGALVSGHRLATLFLCLAVLGLNLGWNFWGGTVEFFALWSGAMTWGTIALWAGLMSLCFWPPRETRSLTDDAVDRGAGAELLDGGEFNAARAAA
jgi:hypothetical protein